MPKLVDLTGQKFNKLTAINREGTTKDGKAKWYFRCDCGGFVIASGKDVRTGNTTSCGCVQKNNRIKHGMCGTRIYRIWQAMHARCRNPNSSHWRHYGGRGISVCERWHDPRLFMEDMLLNYRENLTLERINNDGDYEPNNCKWATQSEQQYHRWECVRARRDKN